MLTKTQQKAKQKLLEAVGTATAQTLVILIGPSGVGKTTVLTESTQELEQAGATVIDYDPRIGLFLDKVNQVDGVVVTSMTRGEFIDHEAWIAESLSRSLVTTPLSAMTASEIKPIIARRAKTLRLTVDALPTAEECLGVPYLLDQFLIPYTDPGERPRLAAEYLHAFLHKSTPWEACRDELLPHFFPIGVPQSVSNILVQIQVVDSQKRSGRIYDDLPDIMEHRHFYSREGKMQDSPIFLDWKSVEIYDELHGFRKGDMPWIEIYAPAVSLDDLGDIERAFGWNRGHYEEYSSAMNRLQMFATSFRKVGLLTISGGTIRTALYGEKSEPDRIHKVAAWHRNLYREGKYAPLVPTGNDDEPGEFLIRAFAHHGQSSQVKVGWATESMLQHRGIPYVVHNHQYGSQYVYVPSEQKILILEEPIPRTYL